VLQALDKVLVSGSGCHKIAYTKRARTVAPLIDVFMPVATRSRIQTDIYDTILYISIVQPKLNLV
jgi:hypothetical protein